MDTEKSGEALNASETPQTEETIMEKEVISNVETLAESTESEKPPAAEETEQLAENGHDTEVINIEKREAAIVVENVSFTEETANGNGIPQGHSDPEEVPAPVVQPEPNELTEKVSDPVAASAVEPETIIPEQRPLPENASEPQPTPELEKPAGAVPEAEPQEQTVPEPVSPPQLGQKENMLEQEKTKVEEPAAVAVAKESAAGEPMVEVQEVKPEESQKVQVTEVLPEMPVEEKSVEVVKETEAAAAGSVESEKKEPEPEEDVVPESGSLSFALLEHEQTKDTLRTSRTLVVLRGLPGSGKSFLARAIAEAYKDHCSVVCADDHGVKPENLEASADGHKALDKAVVTCCSAGTTSPVMIVVDDTNQSQDRLARLGEIAKEHHLVAIFLEPRTAWSFDVAQLSKKNSRGLEEAALEAMKGPLGEISIPLYFGFFLLSSVQDKIKCTANDFLKTLDTLEAFKKHMIDFTGKEESEVDLEQYFQAKEFLHCTTKFCNYGKAEGAKEYAAMPAVKKMYSFIFELSLTALFVTPRTVGAQVSLTEEQLLLWPADAESSVPAGASLPLGSRAHVTLGCAEGVEPVQTGLDLLEILALKQQDPKPDVVEEMELGSLTYYNEGRWMLSLREPIGARACFSSYYKRKESELTKKEPEKKKKFKCAIL